MFKHFIDLRPPAPVRHDVFARVLALVHIASVNGAELAVDWPQWQPAKGQFGAIMRVFGTPADLGELQARMAPYVDEGLIAVTAVALVPANAEYRWMYKRCSRCGRGQSRQRREERRALAKGLEYKPQPAQLSPATHWLKVYSFSGSTAFTFGILRVPAGAIDPAQQNTYGLAVPVPSF